MNCKKHPESPAIGTCEICGAGVCANCAEKTDASITLCTDCFAKEARATYANFKVRADICLIKGIVMSLCWVAGLIVFILALTLYKDTARGFSIGGLIIGLLLCGLPTAILGWKEGTRQHNDYEAKYGAEYTVTSSGVYKKQGFGYKIVFSLLYLVIGIVWTPFRAIRSFTDRKALLCDCNLLLSKLYAINNDEPAEASE